MAAVQALELQLQGRQLVESVRGSRCVGGNVDTDTFHLEADAALDDPKVARPVDFEVGVARVVGLVALEQVAVRTVRTRCVDGRAKDVETGGIGAVRVQREGHELFFPRPLVEVAPADGLTEYRRPWCDASNDVRLRRSSQPFGGVEALPARQSFIGGTPAALRSRILCRERHSLRRRRHLQRLRERETHSRHDEGDLQGPRPTVRHAGGDLGQFLRPQHTAPAPQRRLGRRGSPGTSATRRASA